MLEITIPQRCTRTHVNYVLAEAKILQNLPQRENFHNKTPAVTRENIYAVRGRPAPKRDAPPGHGTRRWLDSGMAYALPILTADAEPSLPVTPP